MSNGSSLLLLMVLPIAIRRILSQGTPAEICSKREKTQMVMENTIPKESKIPRN
jgi:hypothetical protein